MNNMASRVAVVYSIVLFFFVLSASQSQARIPVQVQKPENLATEWKPSNDLPSLPLPDTDDSKSTIVLPSDAIESYYEEVPNDRIVASESKDLPESDNSDGIRTLRPYTLSDDGSFRQIHNHMPLKHHQPFHFRFPIRCRHHLHHGIPFGGMDREMAPRVNHERQISYGNDMILSKPLEDKNGVREEEEMRPHHHHHHNHEEENDMIRSDSSKFDMPRFPRRPMIPRRPVEDNNGFREENEMRPHHHHREEENEYEVKEAREEGGDMRPHHHHHDEEEHDREEGHMRPHHHHYHHEEEERDRKEGGEMRPHHHHHDHEEEEPDREDGGEMRPHRHRHHHHRHHEEEENEQEREGGSFMLFKNFRKFLTDLTI